MHFIELVGVLALIQYLVFVMLVGRARGRYGVYAPATTGNEIFERYFRVQQNTQELLVLFLPVLWLAALYWNPQWVAAIGAFYLIGRLWYCIGYIGDPSKRAMGFGLSAVPIILLLLMALIGVLRSML